MNKSLMGYRRDSPYRNDPFIDIFSPEGLIDMSHTDIDLIGIDEYGNKKKMKAGRKNPYKFEGQNIREIPMQRGGFNDLFGYLFEEDEEEESKENTVTAPSTDELDQREAALTQREKDLADEQEYNMALMQAIQNGENPYVRKEDDSIPVTAGGNPYTSKPASQLNPDNYLTAIFGNEGGKTGVDPAIRGTASGRFGIIKGARKDLYNRYYSKQMNYSQFEQMYNTDPNFEYDVAKKLAQENIQTSKSAAEAIGKWYSPAHAVAGEWNVVPRPDYGNKLTVGQYVNRALKKIQ